MSHLVSLNSRTSRRICQGLQVPSHSPALNVRDLAASSPSSAHCAGVQTPADVEAVHAGRDVGALHAGRERCLRRVPAAGDQDLRLLKLQQPDLPSFK